MNQYDIINIKSNKITHSYISETQRPHNVAWGLLERLKLKAHCSAEELADAIEEVLVVIKPEIPAIPAVTRTRYKIPLPPLEEDAEPEYEWKWEEDCTEEEIESAVESEIVLIEPEVPAIPEVTETYMKLPQTYSVQVTDLTPEIEQENTRRTSISNLKTRIKTLIQKNEADLTNAEIRELLYKLVRFFLLKRDLD
jgi:hypothetical protein